MSSISKKWFFFLLSMVVVVLVLATRYLIRNPKLSLFIKTTTHLSTEDKWVVLSFDDGPNPACTPQLLALLDKYQVKASFFLIGKQLEAYPELAQQICDAGHDLANHSYHHEPMIFKSKATIEEDLLKTDALLNQINCIPSQWYRPPYGYSFINLPLVLKKQQKQLISWSINPSEQYQLPQDPQKIIEQILAQIHNGAIIVLHDGGNFAQPDVLLKVVEQVILTLRSKAYKFVPLSEGIEN